MLSRRDVPVLAALAISAACRPQAAAISTADQQALRALPDSYVQRVRRADWPGVAALYVTNAHMMPPNAAALVGRDAILKFYSALPFAFNSFQLIVDEADGHGDVGYVRGHYTVTYTPTGAKKAVSDTGKFLEARHRQPDGSWPIVVDIWNSDKPATHENERRSARADDPRGTVQPWHYTLAAPDRSESRAATFPLRLVPGIALIRCIRVRGHGLQMEGKWGG